MDLTSSQATPLNESAAVKGNKFDFPFRLHSLLDSVEGTLQEQIVSWCKHGQAFRIIDRRAFENLIMPQFFGKIKYKSFVRQLNIYGFKRVSAKESSENGSYYHHPNFVKGDPQRCRFMERVKVKYTKASKSKKTSAQRCEGDNNTPHHRRCVSFTDASIAPLSPPPNHLKAAPTAMSQSPENKDNYTFSVYSRKRSEVGNIMQHRRCVSSINSNKAPHPSPPNHLKAAPTAMSLDFENKTSEGSNFMWQHKRCVSSIDAIAPTPTSNGNENNQLGNAFYGDSGQRSEGGNNFLRHKRCVSSIGIFTDLFSPPTHLKTAPTSMSPGSESKHVCGVDNDFEQIPEGDKIMQHRRCVSSIGAITGPTLSTTHLETTPTALPIGSETNTHICELFDDFDQRPEGGNTMQHRRCVSLVGILADDTLPPGATAATGNTKRLDPPSKEDACIFDTLYTALYGEQALCNGFSNPGLNGFDPLTRPYMAE